MAQNNKPATNDKTFVMQRAERDSPQEVHLGPVDLNGQTPIVFEIGAYRLTLPVADSIRVGRTCLQGDVQPDVDLTSFSSAQLQISRLHLQLRRRNGLVYLTDLGSANGTWLNGRRLLPNTELLLRDGDELRLASLVIHVKYRTQ